jgi:hypothetical protein
MTARLNAPSGRRDTFSVRHSSALEFGADLHRRPSGQDVCVMATAVECLWGRFPYLAQCSWQRNPVLQTSRHRPALSAASGTGTQRLPDRSGWSWIYQSARLLEDDERAGLMWSWRRGPYRMRYLSPASTPLPPAARKDPGITPAGLARRQFTPSNRLAKRIVANGRTKVTNVAPIQP